MLVGFLAWEFPFLGTLPQTLFLLQITQVVLEKNIFK